MTVSVGLLILYGDFPGNGAAAQCVGSEISIKTISIRRATPMGFGPASANDAEHLGEALYLSTSSVVVTRRGRSKRLAAA